MQQPSQQHQEAEPVIDMINTEDQDLPSDATSTMPAAAAPMLESTTASVMLDNQDQSLIQMDQWHGGMQGGDTVTLVCAFLFGQAATLYFGQAPICEVESHRQYVITTPAWTDATIDYNNLEVPIWLAIRNEPATIDYNNLEVPIWLAIRNEPATVHCLIATHTGQAATYLYMAQQGMTREQACMHTPHTLYFSLFVND
jgi:hypothetical protein